MCMFDVCGGYVMCVDGCVCLCVVGGCVSGVCMCSECLCSV